MIYHILNGDALLSKFPQEIPGERISFRECLVDGPVAAEGLKEFWAIREKFIEENYRPETNAIYKDYALAELSKINLIPDGSQVYCWFEEDLFCQVNLWFCLDMLRGKKIEVYLALPYQDSPYNFTKPTEAELIDTFEHKAHFLSEPERKVLSRLWGYFQKQDAFEALQIADQFAERFPFLRPAVEAWRDMIPMGDFPGKPKAAILTIKEELGETDFISIFREFQKRLPIYGFGDSQILRICKELGIISQSGTK